MLPMQSTMTNPIDFFIADCPDGDRIGLQIFTAKFCGLARAMCLFLPGDYGMLPYVMSAAKVLFMLGATYQIPADPVMPPPLVAGMTHVEQRTWDRSNSHYDQFIAGRAYLQTIYIKGIGKRWEESCIDAQAGFIIMSLRELTTFVEAAIGPINNIDITRFVNKLQVPIKGFGHPEVTEFINSFKSVVSSLQQANQKPTNYQLLAYVDEAFSMQPSLQNIVQRHKDACAEQLPATTPTIETLFPFLLRQVAVTRVDSLGYAGAARQSVEESILH